MDEHQHHRDPRHHRMFSGTLALASLKMMGLSGFLDNWISTAPLAAALRVITPVMVAKWLVAIAAAAVLSGQQIVRMLDSRFL